MRTLVRKPAMPRLSEDIVGARHPLTCQNCGAEGGDISRWQEHDHLDRSEPIVVVLCPDCARGLIDPHPRLYRQMAAQEPLPGTMECCAACRFRENLRCVHPLLQANGGPGLPLKVPQPKGVMFVDGVDKRGRNFGFGANTYNFEDRVICDSRQPVYREDWK